LPNKIDLDGENKRQNSNTIFLPSPPLLPRLDFTPSFPTPVPTAAPARAGIWNGRLWSVGSSSSLLLPLPHAFLCFSVGLSMGSRSLASICHLGSGTFRGLQFECSPVVSPQAAGQSPLRPLEHLLHPLIL